MMNSQKGFNNPLIVVLVGVIILAIGGIFYFGKSSDRITNPFTQNQADETANWKVYTNKYYLYQISVPNDWTVEEVDYQGANDPIERLSSPNKEIIISSRSDDVSLGNAGSWSGVANTTQSAQVGIYTMPLRYELFSPSGGRQAYYIGVAMYEYQGQVSRPLNIAIPSFRIAIKGDFEKNNLMVLQILKTFKNTGTLKSVEDLVEYSFPPGWSQGKSPDYVGAELGEEKGKGMGISVSRSFSLPGHTLESEKNGWKETAGTHDLSDATIDGLPAFKFHEDFEGLHSLRYYVIKDGYGFTIYFFSPDLAEEKKYQKEIDEFLASIRFK